MRTPQRSKFFSLVRIGVLLAILISASFYTYRLYAGAPVVLSEAALQRRAVILPDRAQVTIEKVVSGLINPWGMAFLPDGRILISEKHGEIRIIQDGVLLPDRVEGVPAVYQQGQGGLLDIAPHPDFEKNNWLYLSFAKPGTGGGNTAIARAKLKQRSLTNLEILYHATPNTQMGQHFGSRLAFDSENHLFFSIGDRGERDKNPQNIYRDGGKIYRLNDDGSIPDSNPFFGVDGARQAIYSFGNRNPQGLAFDPATGTLWEHEHGPRGGDEINIIEAGKNYGWPVISFGINYDGTKFTEITEKEGLLQPITFWTPSIAPCGMTIIKGERYPGWKGSLLVGSLKFNHLVLVKMNGNSVASQEIVAEGIGRVRNVQQGLDDYLYAAIEGDGLYRLVPKEHP